MTAPLRAVLFDVGDTLVEHWAPTEKLHELLREALRREFGDREWYERWLDAKLMPPGELRQETLRWYERWFRDAAIGIDDVDLDRLRIAMTVPLDLVSTPVPGAFPAVRWCRERGLRVVIVTNTLSRGDAEVWNDWRRFGLADAIDAVVSSHSAGWQKPDERIFHRALKLARTSAEDAVMVGDRLFEDIWGAKRLGMRAVLRRTTQPQGDVQVTPDAVIDDLVALPGVLAAWAGGPSRIPA